VAKVYWGRKVEKKRPWTAGRTYKTWFWLVLTAFFLTEASRHTPEIVDMVESIKEAVNGKCSK